MTSRELSKGLLRTIFILAIICLSGYLIFKLSSILVYVIISILFTLLANPIVNFLKTKLKFKNTLAVVTTISLFLLLIIGILFLFVPLLISQGQNLSLLDIDKMESNYNEVINSITTYLESHGINASGALETNKLLSSINLDFIPNIFNSIVTIVGNIGIGLASVLFISFFFLKEREQFSNRFDYVLPSKQKDKILTALSSISNLLTRYFGGLMLQLFIILVLYLIVFLIFGVENAFIIALLCAILNIIPYLGPLLGMIVASSLILLSGIGNDFTNDVLPTLTYVLIGMGIVQLIDNNFSQPIIFSKSTKSHPLEIFLVILASGTLFGVTGMLIAVPAYTAIKVIAKEFFPNNKVVKALTREL